MIRTLIKRAITVLLFILPLTVAAQESGSCGRHFLRGEELYRMEKYAEAYDEFVRASKCDVSESTIAREKIDFHRAVSAAKAGRVDAQGLLKEYLRCYAASPGEPEVRFVLGEIYFEQGDYAAAAAEFEQIAPRTLPKEMTDEYNFKIGYANFMQERFQTAMQYMALVGFTSEYFPHAQYLMGYAEYRQGEYVAAKRYFTVIADHPSYKSILPFYLIQIEFNQGNYHYVRENGGAVLRMAAGERLIELNRMIGESWFQTAGWNETVQYLKKYEELGGAMNREESYMIGFSSYMAGDYDVAINYLNRAAGPDDKLSQNASYHLADCYLRAGQKQQAMQSFAIASTAGYDDTISEDALFNYGKLQYELGGGYFNEAINVLNRYLSLYPNSRRGAQVKEYLAAAYYNSKNYDAAYQAIMQVPNPDNNLKAAIQKITYFRALECFNEGDYEAAERLLQQSLANRFNAKYTALAGYWQGELLYEKGDTKRAMEQFKTYIKLSPKNEPENISARYNLGYIYFDTQEWAPAKVSFELFLTDYPAKDSYAADALNRLGDIECSGRSFWRAIELYDQAAAMGTPERYYSGFQRAMMLGMVQRPERKMESLMEIVRKNEGPYVADAMYELGRSYIGQQRYAEATVTLEKFIAAYPSSPRYAAALNELGLAYQNTNNNAKALAYYKRVLEHEKNSDASRSAMDGIRTIYVEQNDVDAYFSYAKSVGVETNLDAVQRDSLAFVAAQKVYLSGDTKRASSALDSYLVGYPKGAYVGEALYFAGENAVAAKNKEKAFGYYQRLVKMVANDFTVRGLERFSAVGMELKHYQEAADAYLKLSTLASGQAKKDDALSGYMKAVVAIGNDEKIIAAADDVLAKVSSAAVKRQAQYAKATALRKLNRNSEALPLYTELSRDVSTSEGAESAYRVIAAAHASKNNKKAEELVYAFAEKNSPNSYWLAKSFIILGDIYAEAGDKFQARATYQSVVDGYPNTTDGLMDEAKKRIASL